MGKRCGVLMAGLWAALITIAVLALPGQAQAQAREPGPPVEVTGTLELVIVEDFTRGRSELRFHILDAASDTVFELRFDRTPAGHWKTGDTVTVRGHAIGRRISVSEMNAALVEDGTLDSGPASDAGIVPASERRAVVLMVDLLDAKASSYYTLDQIASIMFTGTQSVDGLYRESSFGQLSFPGDTDGDGQPDVFGPFAINDSGNDCDYYAWAYAADDAAEAAGIDLSQYQHRIYVLPPYSKLGCTWAGVANVGGPRSWIAIANEPIVFVHELGHNLGMRHAGTLSNSYGDHSDFMGNSYSWHHLNGAHMDQMGWLAAVEGGLVNVFAGGTYDLYPVGDDAALGGLRVLKIAKSDSNEFYYLSFRQRGGYDTTLSSTYTQGVNIHRYRGSGATMTYFLRSLADGGQFEDQANGITITQLGRAPDNSYVTVAIDFGCSIGNPTISLAPAEQGLAPGETTSHTVYLSNNDMTGCPGTTFDLSASFGSDLTGSLSVSQLTLLPGETGTAALQVTAGTLDGTYLATVTAVDGDGLEPNHTGTFEAAATLMVDATAPLAPTGLNASLSGKGDQVNLAWNTAEDGDGSGVASYRIYRDAGAGFVEIGQSGRTDYADGSVAFESTYSYLVTAVDQANNESADSGMVEITTGQGKAKAKAKRKGWGKGGKKGA